MPTYRDNIADFASLLSLLYANKSMTEAQALALASDKPSTVYLTTDTHSIVSGGVVYGRGSQMTNAFRLVSDTSGQSSWDTSCIYLVPTGTAGQFTAYSYSGSSWSNVGTQSLSVVQQASGVTFDNSTVNLGATVQAAIDALATTAKWELIRNIFPPQKISSYWSLSSIVRPAALNASGVVITQSSTAWGIYYSLVPIPKGTLVHMTVTYSTAHALTFAISTSSPQDYYTEHSNSLIGYEADDVLYRATVKVNDVYFELPYDGYVIYSRCTSNVTVSLSLDFWPLDQYRRLIETS